MCQVFRRVGGRNRLQVCPLLKSSVIFVRADTRPIIGGDDFKPHPGLIREVPQV
jgi:hypothetical protein